ncbi:MAG: hypothetical protein ACOC9R_03685 [bacterium]
MEHAGDVEDLIYLVADTQTLGEPGLAVLRTDRNATLKVVEIRPAAEPDALVD